MRKIFRYKFGLGSNGAVKMPQDAKILSVRLEGADITLWAAVDTSRPMITKQFQLCSTGDLVGERQLESYVGMVQEGENLVWHIFERVE